MRLLMCPPDYYGVEYEINPWMNRQRQTNPWLAQDQWQKLYRLLSVQLGVGIELIEPRPGLPDMVFTANGGIVWQDSFIVSNFRHEQRRPESHAHEAWFSNRGYEIHHLPKDCFFEGEGDLLKCGGLLFAGYRIRTDIRSHQKVSQILDQEILSLELVNDWFYHLDTCFCPLREGQALYYPKAFDSYAETVLANHIPELIPVAPGDAERFACNAIVLRNQIVMNAGCQSTREQLEGLGYQVFETPLDEFIKAGGSAKCLVLNLDQDALVEKVLPAQSADVRLLK